MVAVNLEREKKRQGANAASGATGIPGAVQAKFEAASGMSFEDVRVHYNSSRPAQLGAYAYTQGSQVYIGPGQERYLEHELGHVIQQKQGIVRADGYINGVPVNRDRRLEQAADLGAEQPVQGFWKDLGGVVQMAPGEEEEEEEEKAEPAAEEAEGGVEIDPHAIRYSQSSVNGSQAIIDSMRSNGWAGDPIDIVRMEDGRFTTVDNTRVVAARTVGINVRARIHEFEEQLPEEFVERFTVRGHEPHTWGEAVTLRIGKQKKSFSRDNPSGSDEMEKIN